MTPIIRKTMILVKKVTNLLRRVLNIYDPVEGTPSLAQLHVHLALHIHEHESARETDGHHNQLGPKRPFQRALLYVRERGM